MESEALRKSRAVHVSYVIAIAVIGPLMGMLLLGGYIYLASRGNHDSTCLVVETNLREKNARLQAYRETPPATEAGRNIQQAEQDAAVAWQKLSNTLNCEG